MVLVLPDGTGAGLLNINETFSDSHSNNLTKSSTNTIEARTIFQGMRIIRSAIL
jgi:hypothetical protein